MKATTLRQRFRAIPKEERDAHQPFSIRVWRGLSWLERSEEAEDVEGRFISLWIAFNAIYGHLEDEGRNAQDRTSWQTFLSRLVKHDADDALGQAVRDRPDDILPLIDNRFLFKPFWLGQEDADEKLARARRRALRAYNDGSTLAVLQELFERFYVLRMQVFHGAAAPRGGRCADSLISGLLFMFIAACRAVPHMQARLRSWRAVAKGYSFCQLLATSRVVDTSRWVSYHSWWLTCCESCEATRHVPVNLGWSIVVANSF